MKKLDELLLKCDELMRRALEKGVEADRELAKNLFNHSRILELTERSMRSLDNWQSGSDAICEPFLERHGGQPNLPERDANPTG